MHEVGLFVSAVTIIFLASVQVSDTRFGTFIMVTNSWIMLLVIFEVPIFIFFAHLFIPV